MKLVWILGIRHNPFELRFEREVSANQKGLRAIPASINRPHTLNRRSDKKHHLLGEKGEAPFDERVAQQHQEQQSNHKPRPRDGRPRPRPWPRLHCTGTGAGTYAALTPAGVGPIAGAGIGTTSRACSSPAALRPGPPPPAPPRLVEPVARELNQSPHARIMPQSDRRYATSRGQDCRRRRESRSPHAY